MQPTTTQQRTKAIGLRLPASSIPAVAWGRWEVVPRAKGFHVSRESANGTRTEALTNEVGRIKVFRKHALAATACAQANFKADAERLSAEPMLSGKGGQQ